MQLQLVCYWGFGFIIIKYHVTEYMPVSYTHLRFYPELSQKRIDEVLEELELTKYKDEPVGKFSMGMKQRLGFGAAILHKPKLLILDVYKRQLLDLDLPL